MALNLENLKSELTIAEKRLKEKEVQDNEKLFRTLKTKISILKTQIAHLEKKEGKKVVEPKVEPKKVVAPKKVAEPKKEKVEPKKVVKEKPKKAEKVEKPKKEKPNVSVGDFKVGDKVSFIDKETDKKKIGELVRIEKTGAGDTHNVFVLTKDGKKQKMRIHKITKE